MKSILFNISVAAWLLVTFSCKEEIPEFIKKTDPPVIENFNPQSAKIGEEILITGENLQWVDSVYIGTGKATIKYKLSNNKLVVLVNTDIRDGKITLFSRGGNAESPNMFNVNYTVPVITSVPAAAKVNEEIEILGEELAAVTDVYIGGVKAKILLKNSKDMLVKVPFTDAPDQQVVFKYFDGTTFQGEASPDVLEVITEVPVIHAFPDNIIAAKTYTLSGKNLMNVEEVFVNGYPARIIPWADQSDSLDVVTGKTIKFNLPATYITTTTSNCTLRLTYYGGQIKEVSTALTVHPVQHPAGYLYWEDIVLYAQDPSHTEHFFSPNDGMVYSPCMVLERQNDVYFYMRSGTDYIQLVNPNNSDSDINYFLCNNTKLDKQKLSNWVMFRPLIATDAAGSSHATVRDMLLAGSITEAFEYMREPSNPRFKAGSSTPKAYLPGSATASAFTEGYPIVFQRMDNGTSKNVLDQGFIMLKKIHFQMAISKTDMLIDVYFKPSI